MDKNVTIDILKKIYFEHFQCEATSITPLPRSGSDRIYYRLSSDSNTAMGAFNANLSENEAFYSFTKTFRQQGCNVPDLLRIAPDRKHYLITDLGDHSLFNSISKNTGHPDILCEIKKSLLQLINMQIEGGKSIDYSKCYPRQNFDLQSILWDLNYFKYSFLKLAHIDFDEQELENDFNALSNFLMEAPANYFMHRDFQSRNIMLIEGEPWLIDYQGGRRGPLQYDVASLLYSPKTGLNKQQRDALLDFYLKQLTEKIDIDTSLFIRYYFGFVMIRILQALGAYGYRGLYEQKPNFRSSIPHAIENLNTLFADNLICIPLPEIERIAKNLSKSEWADKFELPADQLTIRITSFSYKKGIPADPSENGGGFVFDCRGLPNPGRYAEYRRLSGLDNDVVDYLEKYDEVKNFQENVQQITRISIVEYQKRGFNHLCVNFGCTGGQHRSVYNAQKFSTWVENNFPVKVVLIHNEKNNWQK